MKRLLLLLVVGCHESPQPVKTANDVSGSAPAVAEGDGGVAASPGPAVAAGHPTAVAAPVKPKPAKVRLVVRSNPPKALVSWGKKKLGPTPVILDRPRGSGPMDLIVRSDGYFPIHTRAYTFKNDVLWVKLTKLKDKMTLFGAKQELEPSPSPSPLPLP